MRILVLSLLRIGDIALSAPALRGLRDKYPSAIIHVAINRQCRSIAPLFPYIDSFIEFDRENIQQGLGEAQRPVFESYERLIRWIDEINIEPYDLAINLTHSRISGWLMGLIDAKSRLGLCLDPQGQASFGNPWFRYLNAQVGSESSEVFHFTDVFRFALDIDDSQGRLQTLLETDQGKLEIRHLPGDKTNRICIQPLTSDAKKDWSLDGYGRALAMFSKLEPSSEILILGAPFERDRLSGWVENLKEQGVKATLAILTLEGAFSLLKNSRMLLTGDTSIKHLATAARTAILELALGSADPYRTGAYRNGSVIVKSKEGCAPCVHSRACHQKTHACAARFSPDLIAMLMTEVYAGRSFQLPTLAQEYKNDVEILSVDVGTATFFAAASVIEPFSEMGIGRWLDLVSRRIHLQKQADNRNQIADGLGHEMFRLVQFFKELHPEVSDFQWKCMLETFETQAMFVEERVRGFKNHLKVLQTSFEDTRKVHEFVRSLILFRERIRSSPFLQAFKTGLDSVIEDDISPSFTRFRHFNDIILDMEKRTDIHLRMIRALTLFEPQPRLESP
jgi:ADP-heptose:LPS heptosyltransferase